MKDHAEVCPLSRGMMLPCGAIPVRPITGWHSLFPHSVARTANSLPHGRPARMGNDTGLPCSARFARMV